jgi:hypothetical protein
MGKHAVERRVFSWAQGWRDGRVSAYELPVRFRSEVWHGARTIARNEHDDRGRRAYFLAYARAVSAPTSRSAMTKRQARCSG